MHGVLAQEGVDRRRLRVVRDQRAVGDPPHLARRPRVRLLPRPRGPRRPRGVAEDEGDRHGDPGRGEGLPLAPVPDGRDLHGDPDGGPVLRPPRLRERDPQRVLPAVRALDRVHPGGGVQRDHRLRGDVARRPRQRADRERREGVGDAPGAPDRVPSRRRGRDVHGRARPARRDRDPADLPGGRHGRPGRVRLRRRAARDVHAGGGRHLHEGRRRRRRPRGQGRAGDPRGRSTERRHDRGQRRATTSGTAPGWRRTCSSPTRSRSSPR